MYCEKAEIPASEKFQAVKKLRSLKMVMRFDSRFLIGRNGFPTCEKVVCHSGFQQINSICKSQYV